MRQHGRPCSSRHVHVCLLYTSYLKLSCESIAARLGDLRKRGITLREGQTLQQLYDERVPLYERYADITVDCENKSIREIVAEIAARLPK